MTLRFQDYRKAFIGASLISVLLAASPVLSLVISFPKGGERFSELWLLGSNHMAEDYPFNVEVGEPYTLYVGVGNHMGESMYYVLYVKFRNQTQPLPNSNLSTSSSLPSLFEIRAFVQDQETWERPLLFSVVQASSLGTSSYVDRLMINGQSVYVNSSAVWDSENKGFYYQVFFELWLYNVTSERFQFHDRFVGIWLNLTG